MISRPNSKVRLHGKALVSGIRRLWRDRRGATAVEYGFIVALIVLAMIATLGQVGNTTSSLWNNVNSKVTNAH